MQLFIALLFSALFSFVCGAQDKYDVAPNGKVGKGEIPVDYGALVRILDEEFPDTDPDVFHCDDIIDIYFARMNKDDKRGDYGEMKDSFPPERIEKVRRASRRPNSKEAKQKARTRQNKIARSKAIERQRKIKNKMRTCGCWARSSLRGSNKDAESVITPIRKSKPHVATAQKSMAKKPKLKNSAMKLRDTSKTAFTKQLMNVVKLDESPLIHLKIKASHERPSGFEGSHLPESLLDRLNHLKHNSGSLVKETLQALNRHRQHLDAQLADAFAQTLGVESSKGVIDRFYDKEGSLLPTSWNKDDLSQSGRFIANGIDINEEPHVIKEGTEPRAEKFQGQNGDVSTSISTGPTNPPSLQGESYGYWYKILTGCLLGLCALLAVSLAVILCRRRRRKKANDDVDCKFDTTFKEPTVYVSVTNGSLSKQKSSSGKKIGKQPSQDNGSTPDDFKVDTTIDDEHAGVMDDAYANERVVCPDYENVVAPPAYLDVIRAERSDLEQHV